MTRSARGTEGSLEIAASTTSAAHFVPNIFARFRRYHPAVGLHLIVGNAKEVLELVREQHVGLGLLGGHERSPGVRLEQFMPDEIVAVCAPRIRDPKFRRAIGNLKSARDLDLEHLPLIWRRAGSRHTGCGGTGPQREWTEGEEVRSRG